MPLSDLVLPGQYSLPQLGASYNQAFPLQGISSLMQGITQGVELSKEMDLRQQQMQNEAAWRAALLGNKEQNTGVRQQLADLAAKKAAATNLSAGTPIDIKDAQGNPVPAVADGKGGIKFAPKPSQSKAALGNDTGAAMLNSLSDKWDQLGAGTDTISATLKGSELKAKSMFPSTDAGQYNAAAQALAGKLDHDLLGRVNDVTIANAKKAIPGFYDTPESKANKIAYLKNIYKNAMTNNPDGGNGVDYSSPEAKRIQAEYRSGAITKDQANSQLDALGD